MAWEINTFDDLYVWTVTSFYALTGFHSVWYERLSKEDKKLFVSAYSELGKFTIKIANQSQGMVEEEMTTPLGNNPSSVEIANELQGIAEKYNLGSFGYFINQFDSVTDDRFVNMMENIKGEA